MKNQFWLSSLSNCDLHELLSCRLENLEAWRLRRVAIIQARAERIYGIKKKGLERLTSRD